MSKDTIMLQANPETFDAPFIHHTAIVHENAILGSGVKIGPYCCVGQNVQLEHGVELMSHVSIDGYTTIGANTIIYPFASIGHAPQDLKYEGEPSTVIIGKNNKIREYVTIQPGTLTGKMTTTIGDNCLLMAGSHVAHDCIVGNHVIMANNATLGGHVEVGDYVTMGGLSAIHQFVRVGSHVMIGGLSGVTRDVIPYGYVTGVPSHLDGLNLVGLKRRGFSSSTIQRLLRLFDEIFNYSTSMPLSERIETAIEKYKDCEKSMILINFLLSAIKKPICQPKTQT